MEREKARLNRFIGVKELNNKTEVEKNEKLRRSIMDKEKKFKKRFDMQDKVAKEMLKTKHQKLGEKITMA